MAETQELLRQIQAQIQEQFTAQFQALQTTIARQNDALAKQNEQIQSLTSEIATIKLALGTPPQVTPTPPSASDQQPVDALPGSENGLPVVNLSTMTKEPLSQRLPDPPLFTGKKKDLVPFITQLRYKLEGNSDRFPTPRSQFLYAQSRIGGDAAVILGPLYDKDIATTSQLIQFLETSYGDPNRKATALARLNLLKQGKRSFVSHFAEFRRIAADSELNETGLVMQLKSSLSPELQRVMIGTVTPDTLNDYANQIARYDNDLRYINARGAPRSAPGRTPSTRDSDAMEINSLDYAPYGSKERERRRKNDLCFKCGSAEHFSHDCSKPIPGYNKKNRSREVNVINKSSSRSHSRSHSPRSPRHTPNSSRSSSASSSGSRKPKGKSRN